MMKNSINEWRQELKNWLKPTIIWDLQWVYGVGTMDPYFLYLLSLRAILWWWDENKEIVLPNAEKSIQSKLYNLKWDLLEVLWINESQIIIWDFRKKTLPEKRQSYMRTPYYLSDDRDYLNSQKEILELVRLFWDKVYLADFIKKNNLENLIPSNTTTFVDGNNWNNVLSEIKNRFESKSNFIVKAGEWASWENMILVFFENNNIYVMHHKTNWKKQKIESFEELKKELNIAIPDIQKTKKWMFNHNGYDENAILEQYFLVQDLVDTSKYEEKSINFYITENGEFYPTSFGSNIAVWWVHKWNIEEVLNKKILKKFEPLLKKMVEKWYTWPIWFDFFLNNKNDVKIIEANTRYTAPITPSMLVYKLQEQWKIWRWFTWKLMQKFDTKVDLTSLDDFKEYNLVDKLIKEKDIKDACFLVYSPVFGEKYQSVIFIWPNQESINVLIKKLESKLRNFNI